MNVPPELPGAPGPRPEPGSDTDFLTDLPPLAPANQGWWYRVGGGSLTISLIIHAIVIVLAVVLVWQVQKPAPETIEFLAGGGGGGKGADAKLAERRRAAAMSAPRTRTISSSTNAEVALPDLQSTLTDLSSLSVSAPMAGGIGGGVGGISGSGQGGMMGNGIGTGFGPGRGNGFVSIPKIFGQAIDARRMAVVLDMSGSMYPFLPTVIKEVDKVAPGSTVVLHYGCGLNDENERAPKLESTSDREFLRDRIATSLLESGIGSMTEEERKTLLELVRKRPKTFFVPSSTVGTTWAALTDDRLKDADAIYWFADFADGLSRERMEEISRKLKSRKQKLYIHPSNPQWLVGGDPLAVNVSKIDKEMVQPSGGKVIKAEVKKDLPVKEDARPAKPSA